MLSGNCHTYHIYDHWGVGVGVGQPPMETSELIGHRTATEHARLPETVEHLSLKHVNNTPTTAMQTGGIFCYVCTLYIC